MILLSFSLFALLSISRSTNRLHRCKCSNLHNSTYIYIIPVLSYRNFQRATRTRCALRMIQVQVMIRIIRGLVGCTLLVVRRTTILMVTSSNRPVCRAISHFLVSSHIAIIVFVIIAHACTHARTHTKTHILYRHEVSRVTLKLPIDAIGMNKAFGERTKERGKERKKGAK